MNIHQLSTSLRFLSLAMVQNANSGHIGLPLGMADVCAVLWSKHLRWTKYASKLIDKDRFILSAGHGSALLYSLLHLFGDATINDLKNFRNSCKTPGHPELNCINGVELTTGPLGQGLAWGIGMAKAAMINMQNANISKHNEHNIQPKVYILCSDGCLMEGISHEAASLAGLWQLNNIIVLWDDNEVTIDGNTSLSVFDDTVMRFKSYRWNVFECNGHDLADIDQAILLAKQSTKPALIRCKTIIGYGLSCAGSHLAHGNNIDQNEYEKMQQKFKWPHAAFEIPKDVYKMCDERSMKVFQQINGDNCKYSSISRIKLDDTLKSSMITDKSLSTRESSSIILNEIVAKFKNVWIGSADLGKSTGTFISNAISDNRYIHFGVREHAMYAIMGGFALYFKDDFTIKTISSTFLVFSDYARPAIRLAALMKVPTILIASHDSVAVGEDGPTHQPVEHLCSLRAIPNLYVFRPSCSEEVASAYYIAFTSNYPSVIALTRQILPKLNFATQKNIYDASKNGGYVLYDSLQHSLYDQAENMNTNLERNAKQNKLIVIIATGSEIFTALEVAKILKSKKLNVKIISMPCYELFLQQNQKYQNETLDKNNRCLSVLIEASNSRFIDVDLFFGISNFGESCKGEKIMQKNFNIEKIASEIIFNI